MDEEQKQEIIQRVLGEDSVDFLKKARMHPHIKLIVTNHMVDYSTVKENLDFLLGKLRMGNVSPFSSLEEVKEAYDYSQESIE